MTLQKEILHGLRRIQHSLLFTATTVLVLGLAIASNILVFSLLNIAKLKSLSVDNPEDLVVLKWISPQPVGPEIRKQWSGYEETASFSYVLLHAIQKNSRELTTAFGFAPLSLWDTPVKINNRDVAVHGEMVTGQYFSGLGVRPFLGQLIDPGVGRLGSTPVVVINYSFWAREFGSSPSALGQSVVIKKTPYTIIGVTAPGFSGAELGQTIDFWVPVEQWPENADRLNDSSDWWLTIMGRLAPHAQKERAQAELGGIFRQSLLNANLAQASTLPQLDVLPGRRGIDLMQEQVSRPATVLMLIVGLVFLIACTNIAILQYGRSIGRHKELAIRLSLGAQRITLVRQLFIENLLIAVSGGVVGLIITYLSNRSLAALLKKFLDTDLQIGAINPDVTVIGFSVGVIMLTSVACSMVPIWQIRHTDTISGLKNSLLFTPQGRKPFLKLREILVIGQIALSLLLVMVSGLLVRTLENLKHQDLGFVPQNILLFSVNGAKLGYKGQSLAELYTRVQQRLQGLPSVQSVSSSTTILGSPVSFAMPVSIPGQPKSVNDDVVFLNLVGPDFFSTLGTPVVQGRGLSWNEFKNPIKMAVVNETMARHFFPGTNPVGQQFVLGFISFQIAGVTRNTKERDLRAEAPPTAFVPYSALVPMLRSMPDGIFFEVRTSGDPLSLVATARATVQQIEPKLTLDNVSTQLEQVESAVSRDRLIAQVAGAFTFFVLLQTCISVYAIQSHLVNQRTREIGIRIALGADRPGILWMILSKSSSLIFVALLLGLAVSFSATRLIAAQLYGVKPGDLLTALIAVVIISISTLLGSLAPARRAAHIDPARALHYTE